MSTTAYLSLYFNILFHKLDRTFYALLISCIRQHSDGGMLLCTILNLSKYAIL